MYETFRTHHPQSSDQLLETCLSLLETMKIHHYFYILFQRILEEPVYLVERNHVEIIV